jgi:uncharacterized spore protein YtfJ
VDKGLRRIVDAVAGARLCYGEPVREGERTVIPVTRVKVSGGWGVARNPRRAKDADGGGGGGGGGALDAQPAGFIEVGPDGARFHEIADPDRTQRLLKTGAAAFTAVLAGVAGARGLGARRRVGGRRPAGLLGR